MGSFLLGGVIFGGRLQNVWLNFSRSQIQFIHSFLSFEATVSDSGFGHRTQVVASTNNVLNYRNSIINVFCFHSFLMSCVAQEPWSLLFGHGDYHRRTHTEDWPMGTVRVFVLIVPPYPIASCPLPSSTFPSLKFMPSSLVHPLCSTGSSRKRYTTYVPPQRAGPQKPPCGFLKFWQSLFWCRDVNFAAHPSPFPLEKSSMILFCTPRGLVVWKRGWMA